MEGTTGGCQLIRIRIRIEFNQTCRRWSGEQEVEEHGALSQVTGAQLPAAVASISRGAVSGCPWLGGNSHELEGAQGLESIHGTSQNCLLRKKNIGNQGSPGVAGNDLSERLGRPAGQVQLVLPAQSSVAGRVLGGPSPRGTGAPWGQARGATCSAPPPAVSPRARAQPSGPVGSESVESANLRGMVSGGKKFQKIPESKT